MSDFIRPKLLLILLLPLLVFISVEVSAAVSCYDCHDRANFEKKVIHPPVAQQKCDQCHNPHLARYKGLLLQQGEKLCAKCHQTLFEQLEQRPYSHRPAAKGECLSCHDPHSSAENKLLRDKPATLCLGCHKELQETKKVGHRPFVQGKCNACHDAHSSDQPMLLRQQGAKLCLGCHKEDKKLRSSHLNRKMGKMDCLECHQPHQSDNKMLLRQNQHQPFAAGECQSCHNQPAGEDLCLTCHSEVMKSFNQQFNHITPSASGSFCFNCHTPHASQQEGLIRGYPGEVCRNCHAGKFARRDKNLYLHPHAERCLDCHQLHGAPEPAMLNGPADQSCLKCHEDHDNFSHPTGDAAYDPRNGRPMTCNSCHDPCNGTMFKFNLRGSSDKGLCVQCHAGY